MFNFLIKNLSCKLTNWHCIFWSSWIDYRPRPPPRVHYDANICVDWVTDSSGKGDRTK